MDKERYNQIIDEAYEKYHQENKHVMYLTFLLREEFINKIKKEKEFSEKWELKIEERELSLGEREMYWRNNMGMKDIQFMLYSLDGEEGLHKEYDKQNIPRRTISLMYNNEKIEIYE